MIGEPSRSLSIYCRYNLWLTVSDTRIFVEFSNQARTLRARFSRVAKNSPNVASRRPQLLRNWPLRLSQGSMATRGLRRRLPKSPVERAEFMAHRRASVQRRHYIRHKGRHAGKSGTKTTFPATPALAKSSCARVICVSGSLAAMIGRSIPWRKSSKSFPRSS